MKPVKRRSFLKTGVTAAYAVTLFKKTPFDVPHVRIAHEMGIGYGDLAKIRVERVEA